MEYLPGYKFYNVKDSNPLIPRADREGLDDEYAVQYLYDIFDNNLGKDFIYIIDSDIHNGKTNFIECNALPDCFFYQPIAVSIDSPVPLSPCRGGSHPCGVDKFFLVHRIFLLHYQVATVSAIVVSSFSNWAFGRLTLFKNAERQGIISEIGKIYLVSLIGLLLNLLLMCFLWEKTTLTGCSQK